jgi:integrating conjugative element membrane protein (TIGR03745 family)
LDYNLAFKVKNEQMELLILNYNQWRNKMSFFKNLNNYLKGFVISAMVVTTQTATAALPAAYAGTGETVTDGNWFNLIKNYISEGGDLIGLGLTILAFLVASYFVLAKVGEARKGKAEWAEVGVTAGMGAAAVVLIGFFADQAQSVI